MLKTILYDPQEPAFAGMFDDDEHGRAVSPWAQVRAILRQMGYEITTPARYEGKLRDVHGVVFENMPRDLSRKRRRRLKDFFKPKTFYQRCLSAGIADRISVALMEPAVVLPENYDEGLHGRFRSIYTWSRVLLDRGAPYHQIFFLQPLDLRTPAEVPFADRRLLCNFSGNKTSSHERELYSSRLEVIRHMEQCGPSDFDHYGPGWGDGYPLWKGTVPDKISLMSKYKFNLSYENMVNEIGYVTERIFDSFRGGSVPVYLGAQDIGRYVPESAFVDRRAFSSTSELVEFLRAMPESEWKNIRAAGSAFLASDAYRSRTAEGVAGLLLAGFR